MEEAAVLAALSALVVKVTDFLRMLTAWARGAAEQASAVLTQIAAWVAGVATTMLAAHSSAIGDLTIPKVGVRLGSLDGSSQVLLGLMVASVGSFLVDFKQARDNTDSAAKPPLLKGGA